MNISEWLLILATLAGPVVAVQTQKWIERATESKRKRRWIFDTLMANRATRLADEHVKALNLIDLEFGRSKFRSAQDRDVIAAWRTLFGELTRGLPAGDEQQPTMIAAWQRRCDDLYVVLLRAMATSLGFGFNDEELRRGVYYPRGHSDRESSILAILHNLKRVMTGEASFPMKVTEFPVSPEIAQAQARVFEKLNNAYAEDGSLKVTLTGDKQQ